MAAASLWLPAAFEMSFYDDAATTALGLLADFGVARSFSRIAKTLNPVTGETSAAVAQSQSLSSVVLPIKARDASKMDNKLVEALTAGRLRKMIVAAKLATFELQPNDVASFDNRFWIVRGAETLAPAGIAVIYTLIVEQGNLSDIDQAALP